MSFQTLGKNGWFASCLISIQPVLAILFVESVNRLLITLYMLLGIV